MKSLESFKEEPNKKKKNKNKNRNILEEDDDEDDLIDRYEVEDKRLTQYNYLLNRKKKKKLPPLFYILIFSILVFLGFFIYFIVMSITKKENYSYELEGIDKPDLSEFKYSTLIFDNKLEVLLVQIGQNDTAGGSIIFDTGYLDSQYEYGDLKIALNSIVNKTNISNTTPDLADYLGNFEINVDEYYSFFSFSILNDGFFKFLKTFQKLSYKDNDYNKDIIQHEIREVNMANRGQIYNRRETFFLQYMIYGCKNLLSENNDTYITSKNISKINDIIDKILKPNKIKIVLASHYKPSMMKKKFLKYFENIINQEKSLKEENSEYKNFKLSKKKIMLVEQSQNHYIKIVFFIENIGENDNYEILNKIGYFNLLKYILEQRNEYSLYYHLTKLNTEPSNFIIKDLSYDYEIILKNKLKFSIKIDLVPSNYPYLDEIIFRAYQYINALKQSIDKNLFDFNKVLNEIDIINKQNFTFTEDINDIIPFTQRLGIKLCNKRNKNNFFKDNWIDNNITIAKILFNQLTPNNSVLILGLNEEGKNITINQKSKYQFINYTLLFENKQKIYNSSSLYYSIIELDTNFEKNFTDIINIPFKENKYISTFTRPIKVENKDNFKFATEIINKTSLREFRFLRDTRFRLPKVHIGLNLLHPYYRPSNNSNETKISNYSNHCLYFEYIMFLVFIQKEIKVKLADAIRAGNKISVGCSQDYIFVDIFAFEDVVKNISIKVKEIIYDKDTFETIHNTNDEILELYIQSALSDYVKVRMDFSNREKFFLYYSLNEHIYNIYEFPPELKNLDDYQQFCNYSSPDSIYNTITNYLIDGQIYGYYTKDKAIEIANLFKENEHDEENFETTLQNAGLSKENLSANNFRNWIFMQNTDIFNKQIKTITTNKTLNNSKYRYIFWSDYSSVNRVKSSVFFHIIDGLKAIDNYSLNYYIIYYNATYFFMGIRKYPNQTFPNDNSTFDHIKEKILEKYNSLKSHYNSRLDVVGSRFYYLIKNTITQQYILPRDMENNAMKLLKSDLYVPVNLEELNKKAKELKEMNYQELYNHFKDICFKNYIEAYYE